MLQCCLLLSAIVSLSESVRVIPDEDISQTYREKLEITSKKFMPTSVKQAGIFFPPQCFYILHKRVVVVYLCYWIICPFRVRKVWFRYVQSVENVVPGIFSFADLTAGKLSGFSVNARSGRRAKDTKELCFFREADKCSGASSSCYSNGARRCRGEISSSGPPSM